MDQAPVASAQGQHFPCRACGAPAMTFDAAQGAMRCPFCHHVEAIQAAPAEGPAMHARERSLAEGLVQGAQAGDGYGVATRAVRCQTCGATVAFTGTAIAKSCDFCGSQHVLEQEGQRNLIRPESLVPFGVASERAKQQFQAWLGSGFFRPGDLSRAARLGEIAGVYVPYWTFDCTVDSEWRAQRGHYYYETETQVQVVNGQKQSVQKQVQKTRWEPAQGRRRDRYDDVLVVASKGLPEKVARQMTTFDTRALVPYDPRFLAGFHAEEYGVGLDEGWQKAQQIVSQEQDTRCRRDIGGDTHQSFQSRHQFGEQTFKHVLLPLWIAAYRYQDKTYRFLVNGQTGEVRGEAPTSWVKVMLVVLVVAAVIAAIIFGVRAAGE
ncbi:MAG: hypothetical protein KF901_14860 [Myxococcales bacterium]|nr:hypothetical protein [Myxococcales bacterium]